MRKHLHLYRYYIAMPKKDKIRRIVLNNDAKEVLRKILSLHDNNWLFPNKDDSTICSHTYEFDKTIRKVCRRLGIPERSMHKLRKTYASYALSQTHLGVTDKLVQMQLGHSDISTTHQAYYYDLYDTKEEIAILGGIKIG